jgi:hypothetical protein
VTFKLTLTDSEGIVLNTYTIANNTFEDGYDLTTTFGAAGLINDINREISIAEGGR